MQLERRVEADAKDVGQTSPLIGLSSLQASQSELV